MAIRVFIVDDETLARQKIRDQLLEEGDIEVVGEAGDGPEAVKKIQKAKPDLVFLDIRMPGLDGFEVLEALDLDPFPAVIFATAYDQYALRAFEQHALDYLLKPFDRERLHEAVAHARRRLAGGGFQGDWGERISEILRASPRAEGYRSRFAVPAKGRLYFVEAEDVERIEAAGNYVLLHAPPHEHPLRSPLGELEKTLDPKVFVRIHRSTIVRADRIQEVRPLLRGGASVLLKSGAKAFASRHYRNSLRRILNGLG
ncbi:MAG: response regulator [Candidatus Aminicenantes bacterium]|nr:response regulator [Candidatus Aminicenantes bacterium]